MLAAIASSPVERMIGTSRRSAHVETAMSAAPAVNHDQRQHQAERVNVSGGI